MDNNDIKKEADRISKELIKINKSNQSLDTIFHSLLNKEFESYAMKVLLYLSNELIDKNYAIESANPFCLKKIQI